MTMFNRRVVMAAAALTSISLGALATAVPIHLSAPIEETATSPVQRRRRRSQVPAGGGAQRRSRGPQAKPARKTNMVRHGQRVRRRHRRAA